jgi:hypothetical protein
MVGQLVKIGSSTEADNRLYIANLDGYAGCYDWQPLFRIHVENSGKVETSVQSKLKQYKKPINFVRNGNRQIAREVFACSYNLAYTELSTTLQIFGILETKPWRAEQHVLDNYEFDRL